ncbi:MAG: hypothetical protein ACR2PK_15370 [Acidimicrobiales bacterium]
MGKSYAGELRTKPSTLISGHHAQAEHVREPHHNRDALDQARHYIRKKLDAARRTDTAYQEWAVLRAKAKREFVALEKVADSRWPVYGYRGTDRADSVAWLNAQRANLIRAVADGRFIPAGSTQATPTGHTAATGDTAHVTKVYRPQFARPSSVLGRVTLRPSATVLLRAVTDGRWRSDR